MAKALNCFLNRRQAAQSAQLSAALAGKLSVSSSIRDIEDSAGSDTTSSWGEGQSSARDRRKKRLQMSSSISCSDAIRTEGDDDDDDDDDDKEISGSSSSVDYSHSFISFNDQVSDSLTSSQSTIEATLRASQEECVGKKVPKKSAGRSPSEDSSSGQSAAAARPYGPRSKDPRLSGGLSDRGNVSTESSTHDTSSPAGGSGPKCVRVGKSVMVVKPRPLPYPRSLRGPVDSPDESLADQAVSTLGASSSPSTTLTSHSCALEEEQDSSSPSKNVSNLHPPETGPTCNDEDAQRAYADEVVKWARSKLSSPAPPIRAANDSHGYKPPVSNGEAGQDDGDGGDWAVKGDQDAAQVGWWKGREIFRLKDADIVCSLKNNYPNYPY